MKDFKLKLFAHKKLNFLSWNCFILGQLISFHLEYAHSFYSLITVRCVIPIYFCTEKLLVACFSSDIEKVEGHRKGEQGKRVRGKYGKQRGSWKSF